MTNTRSTHHSSTHGHPSHGQSAPASAKTAARKVIVVFKEDTPSSKIDEAIRQVEAQGGSITHRYDSALLGFSATLPEVGVQSLQAHPDLDYIEDDAVVTIQQ